MFSILLTIIIAARNHITFRQQTTESRRVITQDVSGARKGLRWFPALRNLMADKVCNDDLAVSRYRHDHRDQQPLPPHLWVECK